MRQHLDTFIDQVIAERRKKPIKAPERPKFIYRLSRDIDDTTLSAILDPYKGFVTLPFECCSVYAGMRKGVTARIYEGGVRSEPALKLLNRY